MKIKIYAKSRRKIKTYEAEAIFYDGKVKVKKGSRINIKHGERFKPSKIVKNYLEDKTIVDENGFILKDVIFNSLSTAAMFVSGSAVNGTIFWKTADGKTASEQHL